MRCLGHECMTMTSTMDISKVSVLVTPSWLSQQLISSNEAETSNPNSIRILDTSCLPDPTVDGYKKFFQEGHIPNSLHFDLNKITPASPGPTNLSPLPDPNVFQEYARSLGISDHTHVILYDRLNTRSSLRTWFLFRLFGHKHVSVLSGGLKQWIQDGHQITKEELTVEPGEFMVKYRPELLRDYQWMAENMKTGAEQVMDARPAESFQRGHIPESKNIPFTSIFDDNGAVKDEADLKEVFESAGIDLVAPVTSSCRSGYTACGLILAAHVLGKEDVPLYNGSYSEWETLSSPEMMASSTS